MAAKRFNSFDTNSNQYTKLPIQTYPGIEQCSLNLFRPAPDRVFSRYQAKNYFDRLIFDLLKIFGLLLAKFLALAFCHGISLSCFGLMRMVNSHTYLNINHRLVNWIILIVICQIPSHSR